jgi:uncharacterized membrane protein
MPIIDPMYLYLIEILHNIDALNQAVFMILTCAAAGITIIYFVDDNARSLLRTHKKKIVALYIAFIISALIAVLVPTKDAMYKMLLAHYVTTDNIQIVNDAIKTNLQDYLNMLGETVKNLR